MTEGALPKLSEIMSGVVSSAPADETSKAVNDTNPDEGAAQEDLTVDQEIELIADEYEVQKVKLRELIDQGVPLEVLDTLLTVKQDVSHHSIDIGGEQSYTEVSYPVLLLLYKCCEASTHTVEELENLLGSIGDYATSLNAPGIVTPDERIGYAISQYERLREKIFAEE